MLVVSSLASVDDRIRGLKAGGDDYFVKPFVMGELLAQVEALPRRSRAEPRASLAVGLLAMDLIGRTMTRDGQPIALLEYLMRHAGMVVTRAMLEDVWYCRLTTHTNVVDIGSQADEPRPRMSAAHADRKPRPA